MKILMFIDSLVLGGAQRQFTKLAIALHDFGDDVRLCVYYPLQGALTEQQKKIFDITCFEKSYKYDISPLFKLRREIKKSNPDVIVAFLSTPSAYAELSCLTGHSTPVVVSERNGPSEQTSYVKHRLLLSLHSLAKAVVFNNYDYRNSLTSNSPSLKSKAHVIYNGVDKKYSYNKKQFDISTHQDERSNLRIKPLRFCVVSARPTEEKGLFDLIEALYILKISDKKPFLVDWIGPCDNADSNIKRANGYLTRYGLESQWCWKGVKNNMHQIYKEYDALLMPSRREGTSNVLCEAMSVGLPCIASNIADHHEIIHNSGSGILFEVRNVRHLAQSIDQFLNNDAEKQAKYSDRAINYAKENFSMERYASQWRALLSSVVVN